MICCGKERRTKFCPDCGKPLDSDHSLAGLMAYIRQREKVTRKSETVKKWKSWGDELQNLLNEMEESS